MSLPPDLPRPLGEHLEELRRRVIRCLVVWGVATIGFGSWFLLTDPTRILSVVVAPANEVLRESGRGLRVQGTGWMEGVSSFFSLVGLLGLVLTVPFVIFEAWRFVAVGLHPRERRVVGPVIALSIALFAAGFLFSYLWLLPPTMEFLLRFSGTVVDLRPTLASTLGLILRLCAAIGATFEIPLVMAALSYLGLVGPATWVRRWREAVFGCFLLSAVITPTQDPLTMMIVALPILALYAAGVAFARWAGA